MDNKKKLILGALVVAILGIGTFQFSGGSEQAPPPPPKEAPKVAAENKNENLVVNAYPPFEARDPFKAAQLPGGIPTQPVMVPEHAPKNVKPIPEFNPGGQFSPITLPAPDQQNPAVFAVEPEFRYVLVGIVQGDIPAAVFADEAGNQRLITLGGAIDGDSKLISVERGKATVKFNKHTLTLTIGGTASAK
jgi:hypothetical protein